MLLEEFLQPLQLILLGFCAVIVVKSVLYSSLPRPWYCRGFGGGKAISRFVAVQAAFLPTLLEDVVRIKERYRGATEGNSMPSCSRATGW